MQRKTNPARRRTLAALPLLGAMTACAPGLPALNVETQWAQAMARLSMFGVYPAREDVMVGDLLLYVPPSSRRGPADGELARFLTTRLASPPCAQLMAALTWQGRDRPRLQPIPVSGAAEMVAAAEAPRRAGAAGSAYHSQGDLCLWQDRRPGAPRRPASDRGAFEIGSSDDLAATPAVRLQRGQVPALAVARVTEGQLVGQGIFGGLGASLGLAASGNIALRIELKNIELLRLDPPRVTDMVRRVLLDDFMAREHGQPQRDRALRFHPADMIRALDQQSTANRPLAMLACAGRFDEVARHGARVLAVNDVMYARTISFAFSRNSAAAVRLAADLQQVLGMGAASAPAARSGAPAPAALPGAQPGPAATTVARETIERLNRLAGTPAGGDATIRSEFAVSSAGELSLNSTTARPIAVGFGAALEFTIENVMVPTHASQIEEAKAVCATLVRQPMSTVTERLLRANLEMVREEARRERQPQAPAPATPADPLGDGGAPNRYLLAPIFPGRG